MNDQLAIFGGTNQWVGGGPSQQISEEDQKLCDACRTGDIKAAEEALKNGANPSVQFRLALGEITPIFLCASRGYIEIAELLIKYKANINKTMDFDGTICLHHAASNDQPEMCEFLIKHGCDVNHTDKLGRTPLMDAAEIGSSAVINVLINNDAEVNAEDKEHHSALSYCIDFISRKEPKFFQAAITLINHDANPNYAGKFANRMILHCAAAQGRLELVKQLVNDHQALIRVYDNENKTPIDYARENKHKEVEEFLNAKLAEIDTCCVIL
mmetsp:Transcript_50500/g.61923  ORF Transcript_50500/g.61923 Transcript_50500/m.61923 type:complete len:270 (-) Transcript_50500:313-1122(-)